MKKSAKLQEQNQSLTILNTKTNPEKLKLRENDGFI